MPFLPICNSSSFARLGWPVRNASQHSETSDESSYKSVGFILCWSSPSRARCKTEPFRKGKPFYAAVFCWREAGCRTESVSAAHVSAGKRKQRRSKNRWKRQHRKRVSPRSLSRRLLLLYFGTTVVARGPCRGQCSAVLGMRFSRDNLTLLAEKSPNTARDKVQADQVA